MIAGQVQTISKNLEQIAKGNNLITAIISSEPVVTDEKTIYSGKNVTIQLKSINDKNTLLWTMKSPEEADWKIAVRLCAANGAKTLVFIGKTPREMSDSPDVCLVSDHINVSGKNPLIGINDDSRGARFPDMTDLYNKELSLLIQRCCDSIGMSVKSYTILVPRESDITTSLENKILGLRDNIILSKDIYAAAIVAKHQSLVSTGLFFSRFLNSEKKNQFLECLLKNL